MTESPRINDLYGKIEQVKQEVEEVKQGVKECNRKLDVILRHITGLG